MYDLAGYMVGLLRIYVKCDQWTMYSPSKVTRTQCFSGNKSKIYPTSAKNQTYSKTEGTTYFVFPENTGYEISWTDYKQWFSQLSITNNYWLLNDSYWSHNVTDVEILVRRQKSRPNILMTGWRSIVYVDTKNTRLIIKLQKSVIWPIGKRFLPFLSLRP